MVRSRPHLLTTVVAFVPCWACEAPSGGFAPADSAGATGAEAGETGFDGSDPADDGAFRRDGATEADCRDGEREGTPVGGAPRDSEGWRFQGLPTQRLGQLIDLDGHRALAGTRAGTAYVF